MSNPRLSTFAPALLLLPLALALRPAVQEPHLSDSDLKKLGAALKEYIEESASTEAALEVKEQMDKLEKKLSKTPVQGDILASPADLGLAYWLAYDYAKKRGPKGKVSEEEYVFERAGFTKREPFEYAIWAPYKYSAKNGPYPLILSLHDEDQTASQHLTEDWMDTDLRDSAILATAQMPEDTGEWEAESIKYVMTLMRVVTETYAVDFNRIYLSGTGVGLIHAGSVAEKFPDRWAGLVGRAGEPGELSAANFRNLPTYFAGGGAKTTAFSDAAKELGFDNVTLEPEGMEKEIWDWIQAHPRAAYPEEIHLTPGSPLPYRSGWLEVPPAEYGGLASVKARLDRDANAVHVEGTGVTDFVLYLNDEILDLTRPITVTANGQESTVQVTRSYKSFLNFLYNGRCDPGRVFVASQSFHLPAVGEAESEDK